MCIPWLPLYFTCNLRNWPEVLRRQCESICRIVAVSVNGRAEVIERAGSYSFRSIGRHPKVLAKLALENCNPPVVLVGFSDSVGSARFFAEEISREVQNRTLMGQRFYMIVDPGGDAHRIADSLARFLGEQHGQG